MLCFESCGSGGKSVCVVCRSWGVDRGCEVGELSWDGLWTGVLCVGVVISCFGGDNEVIGLEGVRWGRVDVCWGMVWVCGCGEGGVE